VTEIVLVLEYDFFTFYMRDKENGKIDMLHYYFYVLFYTSRVVYEVFCTTMQTN